MCWVRVICDSAPFLTSRLQSVVRQAGLVLRKQAQSILHDHMDILEETPSQAPFQKAEAIRPPLPLPSHLQGDSGLPGRVLAVALLELPADVLQEAQLQGGKRCLQVGPTHIVPRQPLQQRLLGAGGMCRGSTPHPQAVAIHQSLKFFTDLSGNLLRDLTGYRTILKLVRT